MCYNETLRIEPPASVSVWASLSQDVTVLNKYVIKKDVPVNLMIKQIHHSKVEWIE
jgi:cytochrome P450